MTFPCGRWLSAEAGLSTELTPGEGASWARYRIEVATGAARGAGTEGSLLVELIGNLASSPGTELRPPSAGPWCLDRAGAFGRGHLDSFDVEGPLIVAPAALRVHLQAVGSNDAGAWLCSHVTVTLLHDGGSSAGGADAGCASGTAAAPAGPLSTASYVNHFPGNRCGMPAYGVGVPHACTRWPPVLRCTDY